MEMERDKRDREAWEANIREMEFLEKMKQEMELKPPGIVARPAFLNLCYVN